MSKLILVERVLAAGEAPTVIGAFRPDQDYFIIKRDGPEGHRGEPAYFFDSWVWTTLRKTAGHERIDRLVIKDMKSGETIEVPGDWVMAFAVKDASERTGYDWALRVRDLPGRLELEDGTKAKSCFLPAKAAEETRGGETGQNGEREGGAPEKGVFDFLS